MKSRKKSNQRLNAVLKCIEHRDGISAYQLYIRELLWYDISDYDSESPVYDSYLFSENILFDVSYDTFNNTYQGDYFTAVIVDTGSEKVFYIVNI